MNPISYRIPVSAFSIDDSEDNSFTVITQLETIKQHLYLAANICYQHFYRLLINGDAEQTTLLQNFTAYLTQNELAWEKLNNAKLTYTQPGLLKETRELAKQVIEQTPDEIRKLRNDAKKAIYLFAKRNNYVQSLTAKFEEFIPEMVMHYSIAKVLQELYTDYPMIVDTDNSMPLRVYSNRFPICFGWNDGLNTSFESLQPETDDTKTQVTFYAYKWMNNQKLCFKCRVGKRQPKLAELFNSIINGTVPYKHCGDPSLIQTGKNKWALQFVYKAEGNTPVPEMNHSIAMGIDLGYKVPIAWAVNNNDFVSGTVGDKDEISNERKKLQERYVQQIAAMQYNKSGRGRSKKSEVLKKRSNDERMYFRQKNAKWAYELVQIAKEHNVAVIKIEDLDFKETKAAIKKRARNVNLHLAQRGTEKKYKSPPDNLLTMFRNWSYSHLAACIEHEAAQHNIMVARIHPGFTSRQCHKCGEKGMRNKQAHLRFTETQASNCKHSKNGSCILLAYDEKEIERQKKQAARSKKDNVQIFTHYLLADDNAAKRMALATQYKTSEEKK
jgi:transposase